MEMYNVVTTAYGLKTRTEDRATSSWLEEARAGLKTSSLKLASTMLEKLVLEGVHSEEMSVGTLGEISFKYRAQGNREIRTVSEFFTVLVRWARGILTAGTIVVGEDGCGPGVGTMGDHGTVGTAAMNKRLHVTLTEVFALLQNHFVLADQPVEVHLSVYAEIMSGVKAQEYGDRRHPGGNNKHHERGGRRRRGGSGGAEEGPEGRSRRAQQDQKRAGPEDRADHAAGGRAPTDPAAGRAAHTTEARALPRSAAQRRSRPLLSCEAVLVASRRVFEGGRVAENIRSLHYAHRGGRRSERARGERAGDLRLTPLCKKGEGEGLSVG